MDNIIFPINKYKGLTYKQVLQKNDDFYYKYLIREFKNYYCDIYNFYGY